MTIGGRSLVATRTSRARTPSGIPAAVGFPMDGDWAELTGYIWTTESSSFPDAAVYVGGQVVICNGFDAAIFDGAAWSAADDPTVPVSATGAFAVLPGGTVAFIASAGTAYTQEYDPIGDAWDNGVTLTPMPDTGRFLFGSTQIGDDFYCVAGQRGDDAAYAAETFVYHTDTDTWDQLADAPYANAPAWCFNQDGHVWAYIDDSSGKMVEYDPALDSWTEHTALSAQLAAISGPEFGVRLAPDRILMTSNATSPSAWLWNLDDAPVSMSSPINPPGTGSAKTGAFVQNKPADGVAWWLGNRVTGPPQQIPFQSFTLG